MFAYTLGNIKTVLFLNIQLSHGIAILYLAFVFCYLILCFINYLWKIHVNMLGSKSPSPSWCDFAIFKIWKQVEVVYLENK